MPCHSRQEDTEHAQSIASKFSIPTKLVVLDTVFDTLLKVLPDEKVDPEANRLAQANLKARLRMIALYHFARSGVDLTDDDKTVLDQLRSLLSQADC